MDFVQQHRWQDLGMLAHTLKGSLGYLGAATLMEQAAGIEAATRQPPHSSAPLPMAEQQFLQQQVPDFSKQLTQLLLQLPKANGLIGTGIAGAATGVTSGLASGVTPVATNSKEISESIARLHQFIADGDYAALEEFERLQRLLDIRRYGVLLQKIRKNVEDLEAEAALKELSFLEQQLALASSPPSSLPTL